MAVGFKGTLVVLNSPNLNDDIFDLSDTWNGFVISQWPNQLKEELEWLLNRAAREHEVEG